MDLVSRLLRVRWFVRAPIGFYRAGLGALLGERMVLVQHRGRTSGQLRQVVLEVSGRPAPDHLVVVSGLGPRSQWYRNVLAEPRVLVSTGRRRDVRAIATVRSPDDAAAFLTTYAREHASSWEMLRSAVEEWAAPLAAEHGEDDWLRVVPVLDLRLLD
ncbi:nitroreductase family deazaflavin-dependent oxidoreductase [Isoptericola jiangsuensis]|uniref:nitroreductase family deazaflavin-dependent oxidoreductase n=1 Tax=Isoptericola jiangsuensis TaxID=548579 RepID=UPI003AAA782D